MRALCSVVTVVAIAAWGCKDSAAVEVPCGPLRVTIDGTSIELPHGFGTRSADGQWSVVRVASPDVGCPQVLDVITADNLEVTAFPEQAGGLGYSFADPRASGFSIDPGAAARCKPGHDCTTIKTKVAKAPAAIGDPMSICVIARVNIGTKGTKRALHVDGMLEGTYCGDEKPPKP